MRAVILAGGEGTRLGVLTAKRTKPAVSFGGKYRIIDFTLSNCVNSGIFDVMIIAQYRPHSLIEHIGAGGPWDLNRDFTGGIRIYTPYRARASGWFVGTADAVQQNFGFIKRGNPENIIILSGDHIYTMDYSEMAEFHESHDADLTMATIDVPLDEASRFGIIGVDANHQVTYFVEKPSQPPSTLANMGVYIFKRTTLDKLLWEDHENENSSHDFGKDIIPNMIKEGYRVFGYPYSGYWVDVGTVTSYWLAHMDLLQSPPALDLNNRSWVIHTRTEERAPIRIEKGAIVEDSLICDGSIIERGAKVIRSTLSPGVHIQAGATVIESILLTDCLVQKGAVVQQAVVDKRARILVGAQVGGMTDGQKIAMIGKNSIVPPYTIVKPGAMVYPDVIPSDYSSSLIESGDSVQTRRQPNEV